MDPVMLDGLPNAGRYGVRARLRCARWPRRRGGRRRTRL